MMEKEQNPYADIIDLSRPVSKKHKPMKRQDRAAQFAPFAALTGFGDSIAETGRLTDQRIEMSDSQLAELDYKWAILEARLEERPKVKVTYFLPDERKSGGAYHIKEGFVRRIDHVARIIYWTDGDELSMDAIVDLNS